MEDRGGQGESGRKRKTITALRPVGGFWEEVRGCRASARFISEALLALKLWTLVQAFIALDIFSHYSPSLFYIFFLNVKRSRSFEYLSVCSQFALINGSIFIEAVIVAKYICV